MVVVGTRDKQAMRKEERRGGRERRKEEGWETGGREGHLPKWRE